MTEPKRDGNVHLELVFPMEHEEGAVQWVCPKLPVSPAEVDLVDEATPAILENLVGQDHRVGKPELERSYGEVQYYPSVR